MSDAINIPCATPCDGCGKPASWLIDDGAGSAWSLCDACHADDWPDPQKEPKTQRWRSRSRGQHIRRRRR